MRRVWAGLGGLLLVCSVLVGAVRVISRRDPPPDVAVLLPDDGCRAPCWQGLRPGTIDDDTFATWLEALAPGWQVIKIDLADYQSLWRARTGAAAFELRLTRDRLPTVDRITLVPDDLTLGDLLAALGAPDYVTVSAERRAYLVGFQFYYVQERLIVDGVLQHPSRGYGLRPDHPIAQLRYEAVPWGRSVVALDWRGLGTLDSYFNGMTP